MVLLECVVFPLRWFNQLLRTLALISQYHTQYLTSGKELRTFVFKLEEIKDQVKQ